MDQKRSLIANTIIKSIVFLAITVSLFYILQPFLNQNGIVVDRVSFPDGTKQLVYGNFNLRLLKTFTIILLVIILSLMSIYIIKNTITIMKYNKNKLVKTKTNFFYIELILVSIVLLFNLYLLFVFPLKTDKYNSYAFGFSISNIILTITLLISSVYSRLSSNKIKKIDISIVAEASVMAALAVVLSLVSKMIPGLQMPNGGSFSLSMLPLFVFALRRGSFAGLVTGAVYGLVNLLTDGLILHWGSIFFDYILPFALLTGVAGLFKKQAEKGLVIFTVLAVILGGLVRYVFHGLSGVIFFAEYADGANPWFYSFIIYNLPYMLVSTVGSLVIIVILQKRLITLSSRIR